jgi:hypothetical protein
MSEAENFFADLKRDGMSLDEMENQTPAESQTETNEPENPEPPQEGTNTPDEKKLDFHEHPRFKEIIAEKNAAQALAKAQAEELAKFKSEFESWKQTPKEESSVPEWFKSIYGDSPEAYKLHQQHEKDLIQQAKVEALKEIEASKSQAQAEEQAANQWLEDSITELQTQGLKFERNKLLKIALEYSPTDENGNLSMKKAYSIYEKLEAAEGNDKSEARKKLASIVTPDSSNVSEGKKDYLTAADIRKMGGWAGIK